jgi:RNA-binding motif X-linked protein 2
MNNIRNIEKIIDEEFKLGIYGGLKKGSWHDEYRDSAWVFIGGLSYELSEGDIICVMSQWGEVDDIHLVREKETGKPKGFAFVKYEDARSTILAVDNFNGIKLLGRTLRVDHMDQYRLPAEIKDQELKKLEELEKERKRGKEIENSKISIEPGHAYRNKELSNKYNIQKGVNLWDSKTGLGEEDDEESGEESGSGKDKKRKHKNKEDKKKKKHKKEDKKERKEKSGIDIEKSGSQEGASERSKKRNREEEEPGKAKVKKENKEKKHHRSKHEDDHRDKKLKVKKEEQSSSSRSKRDNLEDEDDDYPLVKSEPIDYQQLHLKHTIPYGSSLPEGVVASWRGVRDPELHKTAETYELKKKQAEYLAKQKELFPNKSNEEISKDEIGGIGGYKRIR